MYFIWRTFRKISSYIEFISFTFITLYIWETQQSLYPILIFAAVFFAGSPLGSLISVYVCNKISPKIASLLGAFFQTGQALLFIMMYDAIGVEQIVLLGVLGGIGSGFKNVAEYVFERKYESINPEYIVQGTKLFWWEIIKLIATFISSYIVYSHWGFNLLFQIILASLVINSILIVFLSNDFQTKKSQVFNVFKFPGTNPLKGMISRSEYLDGFYDGINQTLIPVTLLFFVGDFLDWGLVNTLLIIFAVFFNIVVTKTSNNFTYKNYYAVSALLLAGTSILLITNFNIYVLLTYMLIMTMNEVSGTIGYNTTIENLTNQDSSKQYMIPEYKLFTEVFFNLGRLSPLTLMIVLGIDYTDEFIVRMALTVGSLLPLLVMSLFGNTFVYNIHTESTDIDPNVVKKTIEVTESLVTPKTSQQPESLPNS